MSPTIGMLAVFLGIVATVGAFWLINLHLRAKSEAATRVARARVLYFVRWITPEQMTALRRHQLAFTSGNLGLIRRAQSDLEEEKALALANAAAISYNKRWRWLRGPDKALIEATPKPEHVLDADEDGIVFDSSAQRLVLRSLGWQVAANINTGIETDNGRYVELVTYQQYSPTDTSRYSLRSRILPSTATQGKRSVESECLEQVR